MTFVWSQKDSTRLLYTKNIESTVFVELASNFIQINKSGGMDIDFSVNYLLKQQHAAGIFYNQLASEETISSIHKYIVAPVGEIQSRFTYQTIGAKYAYLLLPKHKIISVSPEIGVGYSFIKIFTVEEKHKHQAINITPGVKTVFNVSDYFRLGVGLYYRQYFMKEFNTENNEDSDFNSSLSANQLNGISGGVFLRIGKF